MHHQQSTTSPSSAYSSLITEAAGQRSPLQLDTAALIRYHNQQRSKIPYCQLPVFQGGNKVLSTSVTLSTKRCQTIPITQAITLKTLKRCDRSVEPVEAMKSCNTRSDSQKENSQAEHILKDSLYLEKERRIFKVM